jgi:hypothetical protein
MEDVVIRNMEMKDMGRIKKNNQNKIKIHMNNLKIV